MVCVPACGMCHPPTNQVTTIVDGAFGMGFNPRKDKEQMARILAMVRQKKAFEDAGVGEYERLLPKVCGTSDGSGCTMNQGCTSPTPNQLCVLANATPLPSIPIHLPQDQPAGRSGATLGSFDTSVGDEDNARVGLALTCISPLQVSSPSHMYVCGSCTGVGPGGPLMAGRFLAPRG
jgi:hypothetical protein